MCWIPPALCPTSMLRAAGKALRHQWRGKAGLAVNVMSFGFKYGLPLEADLVMDVRFLPNPFYVEGAETAVRS